jgi:hypothetical protein
VAITIDIPQCHRLRRIGGWSKGTPKKKRGIISLNVGGGYHTYAQAQQEGEKGYKPEPAADTLRAARVLLLKTDVHGLPPCIQILPAVLPGWKWKTAATLHPVIGWFSYGYMLQSTTGALIGSMK